jgi:hypothetical protein
LDGQYDPVTGDISIRMGLGNKKTVEVLIHEIFHAVSDERELKLTENQVLGLESSTNNLLKIFGELLK